jgi:NADH-quinone oxidoreductase subunit L
MESSSSLADSALAPSPGFLLNGILGRKLPQVAGDDGRAGARAAGCPSAWALGAAVELFRLPIPCPGFETLPFAWINIAALHVNFSFVLDQLSLVMLLVVTGVGFLIHVYSVGYMDG